MNLRDDLGRLIRRLAGRSPSAEDERLVALFRNRAELKKELSTLDDDRHRLLDRLKLQEGATMRVEEQVATLEAYLGRPEEGLKCLLYFQLKGLWRMASQRIEKFAAELAEQQKDRERKLLMAEFDRGRRGRLADIDRELVEARVLADQLQAEQKLAEQRLATMRGFWNYFDRRRLAEAIGVRAARIDSALTVVTDLEDSRHAVEDEPAPVPESLSLAGQRAVNLAVIACAEWLYERLAEDGLADLSRQTTLRRVYDSSYGTPEQCEAMLRKVAQAIGSLEKQAVDLVAVKARTDILRRSAVYRSEGDTIPTQDSIHAHGAVRGGAHAISLLQDEYFDLYRVLLR
jgi:predicted  nucleic acid-binding Zn-ribbon protein